MDQERFDRIARLLGASGSRRAGLRAALGGLLGVGVATTAATEAPARRRRRRCRPACTAGQTCVKGACACDNGGAVCGAGCCSGGQTCQAGQCVEPSPQCLAFGDPCKNAGVPCCDGLTCASGQGGSYPVTCLKSKGAACASSAECPFGMSCTDGACRGDIATVPTGAACEAGSICAQPGAVCTAYTTPGAPGGEHCTLPLRQVCQGDPDCTCYRCWYVNGGAQGSGRRNRASLNTKACCQPSGQPCASENDCCSGLTCENDVCGGTPCVPEGGKSADGPCCPGFTDQGGVCTGGAANCTVCDDPQRCDYDTIEAAVNDSNAGDVITIAAGTYQPVPTVTQGFVVIEHALTLEPCVPGTTVEISCPTGTSPAPLSCLFLKHETGEVKLEGLKLVGPNNASESWLERAINSTDEASDDDWDATLTVTDSNVSGFKQGLDWNRYSGLTIKGSTFTGLGTGVNFGYGVESEDAVQVTCQGTVSFQDFKKTCSNNTPTPVPSFPNCAACPLPG